MTADSENEPSREQRDETAQQPLQEDPGTLSEKQSKPDAKATEPGIASNEEGGRKGRNPNAEASRYRHRLRETETERDQLSGQVRQAQDTIYQQAVNALRCGHDALTHPDDLSRFTGKQPVDYFTGGHLDQHALQEDADRLHQERPELFRTCRYAPRPDPSQGLGGDGAGSGDAWKSAFKTV